jgi:radical SAM superfamily enzyme YgiQ (UPF0313 family)
MKVTFIMPSVGKQAHGHYVKSWIMEPLAIAVLSALTPPGISKSFFDDRLEDIRYEEPTDLVAINVETYTAKRAYQIAACYKKKGVPVVMGGFHATLLSEEVSRHADAVVVGAAEGVWEQVIRDTQEGMLQKKYHAREQDQDKYVPAERSIYRHKPYSNLNLIETGRGCCFKCEFCSVTHFFRHNYTPRAIEDIVSEIRSLKSKNIFFIDDNIAADPKRARQLFKALLPLKIRWVSQISMQIYQDNELLTLMQESGCAGVLIGFESLKPATLNAMQKDVNKHNLQYAEVVSQFHKHKIAIYATFMFGYSETEEDFQQVYNFGVENKLLYLAFNHVTPFPGTPLYARLKKEGRLLYDRWWLADNYYFGQLTFLPNNTSPEQLTALCFKYRYKFFSLNSIFKRLLGNRNYWQSFLHWLAFLYLNGTAKRETRSRQCLLIGGVQ